MPTIQKTSVNRKELAEALKAAGMSVAKKSSLPILMCACVRATPTDLSVECTDLTASTRVSIGATGDEWAACIGHEQLTDAVSMKGETLQLEFEETSATLIVSNGSTNITLPCLAADEFPMISYDDGAYIGEVDVDEITTVVGFAADKDEARNLNVVQFVGNRMFATDGFRLAVLGTMNTWATPLLVPAESLGRAAGKLGAYALTNGLVLRGDNVVHKMQSVDRTPNAIDSIVPKSFGITATVDPKELSKLMKLSHKFSSDSIARLKLTDTTLSVYAEQSGVGRCDGSVSAVVTGENADGFVISANSKYVADALDAAITLGADSAELKFNKKETPLIITAAGAPTWYVLIMPMHLSKQ